jgi:rhodanese-related sulfurtransferase
MKRLLVTLAVVGVGAALPLLIARQSGDDVAEFRIALEELHQLQADEPVYLIDVRNPQAYADGHIAGAVSIPLDTIDGKVKELRELERPIVTYCRCYEEATSLVAAQRLGRYGIDGARARGGGYDAWAGGGGAVETGTPAAPEAGPAAPADETEPAESDPGPPTH